MEKMIMMMALVFCMTSSIMKELRYRGVLAAIHLMQEGVANFQAGLNKLKIAMEISP